MNPANAYILTRPEPVSAVARVVREAHDHIAWFGSVLAVPPLSHAYVWSPTRRRRCPSVVAKAWQWIGERL